MEKLETRFDYAQFTARNMGFVTEAEQERLEGSTVFVCGTGGMGGGCVLALVRAGVGRLIVADIDRFEISNFNRQVFANLDTLGRRKAEATRELCFKINPELEMIVHQDDWPQHVDALVAESDVVVNGTDDLGASLLLYRTARTLGRAVVDAYAAPLPSVYVTTPDDPMPEERLRYPTLGTPWNELTDSQRREAFMREAEYVLLHSSSHRYVDLALAAEVAVGQRSRMSFAPMVITTAMLMSYEVIAILLRKPTATDFRGWFFNPHRARVEHPRNALVAALLQPVVRRFLLRLTSA